MSLVRGDVGRGGRGMTKHREEKWTSSKPTQQACIGHASCVFGSHPTFYCRLWPWVGVRHALEICRPSLAFFLRLLAHALSTSKNSQAVRVKRIPSLHKNKPGQSLAMRCPRRAEKAWVSYIKSRLACCT